VKETWEYEQRQVKPRSKGVAVPIIHERGWCVLTRLVRRGATARIVGIATV
jgi:hypothetical protein